MNNSPLDNELRILTLQYLRENNFKESAHQFEEASGVFLDLKYIEELTNKGDWDRIEKYLFGFIRIHDNPFSKNTFYEIRKQKYLEAVDRYDRTKALEILKDDLEVFNESDEMVTKNFSKLLPSKNIRINKKYIMYADDKNVFFRKLACLLRSNPTLSNKLEFPAKNKGRLAELMNQSFLHQHHTYCTRPRLNPEFKTLLLDHRCDQNFGFKDPSPFPPVGILQFPTQRIPTNTPSGELFNNASKRPSSSFSSTSIGMSTHNNAGSSSRNIVIDHQRAETEHVPSWLMTSRMFNGASQQATKDFYGGWIDNASHSSVVPRLQASIGTKAPGNSIESIVTDHQRVEAQHVLSKLSPSRVLNEASQQEQPSISEGLFNNPSLQTLSEGLFNNPSLQSLSEFSLSSAATRSPNNSGERPRTSTENMDVDHHRSEIENELRRSLSPRISDEPPQVLDNPYHFPRSLAANLNNDASPTMSMEFHPVMQTLLVVGTCTGAVILWDIRKREKIAVRNFKIWDLRKCSKDLVRNLSHETSISVTRVTWSPDGFNFGIAYSQYLVHVYNYNGGSGLRNHLEIDAHVGSVNDIAFSLVLKELCVITCGDDMTIKVWNASNGEKKMEFKNEAPVFSICPFKKQHVEYIISTSKDGKIKAFFYNDEVPTVTYDVPGNCSTRMLYNADGSRLFSCGTTTEGNTYLVEWNDREGYVKRTYEGLENSSGEIVHFSVFGDRYLAAGNDHMVKIWDMDNSSVLTKIENELPANPHLQFNKEGSLLAITSDTGGIQILATNEGIQKLHEVDSNSSLVLKEKGKSQGSEGETWNVPGIYEPSKCPSLRLVDSLLARNCPVSRLTYSYLGNYILALASNGVHSMWRGKNNANGKAQKVTTKEAPQLYVPRSCEVMINELDSLNNENGTSHFSIAKNDGYLVSLSGGSVTLYYMPKYKAVVTISSPPPQARSVAFLPKDCNIVAIGMEDSSIWIYSSRSDKVERKLHGHEKAVTDLAFSSSLDVLVSSGADFQLCVWNTDEWNKMAIGFLENRTERTSPLSGVHVEFHPDQRQFIAVHEGLIAIYKAPRLKCVRKWVPGNCVQITYATYSCDGKSIFASLRDGTVGVVNAKTLAPRTWISPSAYVPQHIRENNPGVFANMVAAHPSEPNQFALGMTDGGVYLLEPQLSKRRFRRKSQQANTIAVAQKASSSDYQEADVIREHQPFE